MTKDIQSDSDYADDALIASQGMKATEIQDFVERRSKDPYTFEDVTIWSFNNHEIDVEQLREQAENLRADRFIIPYQVSGIWGYIVQFLPERIRTAEILTYRQGDGRYYAYPNYEYRSLQSHNEETTDTIKQFMDEYEV